jgi:flagellar protein FlaG
LPVQSETRPSVSIEAQVGAQAPAAVRGADAATPASPTASRQPSAEELKRISDELQHRTSSAAPELKFAVDADSGRTVIKVTDSTTDKVIRQIPSEEALQISEDMDRFQKGLLLNRKA